MQSTLKQIAAQNGYAWPIFARSTELLNFFMIGFGQEDEIEEIE